MSTEDDGSTPCNSGEGARDGRLMAGGRRRQWVAAEVGSRTDLKGIERVALIINGAVASPISKMIVYYNR